MTSDTSEFVSRSAFRFFSGTVLSRITGMCRDVLMAFFLGTSAPLAAFLLAYRFVYLLRRVFGEGLMHQGFIPHFESVRRRDEKEGALFFRDLFWTMALLIGVVIVFGGMILAFFPGETSRLMLRMLPGVFFICLFGLSTGLLQAEKSFFIPSVAPVAFNLVWIFGLIAFQALPIEQAVAGLSIVISIAFFAQFGITVPKIWHYLRSNLSVREVFQGRFFSKELRKLIQPILLGVAGVAAMQVNSAVDGVFARWADLEGPAYLWYAIRLQQLPLALFGIALSSALLPSLSRAVDLGDESRFRSLLEFAKKRTFTLIFPCVIGIFVLGAASMNLLFGRGDFGQVATCQSTVCLWCYGAGLLPAALVLIYAPAFYARKDYKTPTIGFLGAAILNLGLNAFLVFFLQMGAASVALATSVSSALNALYLSRKLSQRSESFLSMVKVAFCSILAGGAVLLCGRILGDATLGIWLKKALFSRDLSTQVTQLLVQTAIYFGCFFGLSWLFKSEDVMNLYSFSESK